MSGRINLGLNGLFYYSLVMPFINQWKQGARIQVINNGTNYFTDNPPGTANSAWDYLDDDGELINPLPANTTHLLRIFYAQPIDGIPAGFSRTGENWVCKWDGDPACTVLVSLDSVVRVGARLTGVWGDNTGNKQVEFRNFSLTNPPRNVRICKASNEAALDSGEIFDPDWLHQTDLGGGVIRFMDWQCTNNNRVSLSYAGLPTEAYYLWGGSTSIPGLNGGLQLSIIKKLANQINKDPWVCIPVAFGTEKFWAITGITNTNPAVVTSPGHNFVNGDQVIPYRVSGMGQVNRVTYTVANADTVAGTFELSGIDSSAFGVFTAGGWVTSPFSLARITTEITSFATYFRDNLNAGIVPLFEYNNETWNLGTFDGGHWLLAQAEGGFADEDAIKISGYIAAHCMKTIRDVYGDRARWKGIAPTQTVNTGVTTQFFAGVAHYITNNAPGLTIADLFDYVADTGYFGGNLVANGTVGLGTSGAVTINIATSTFTFINSSFTDREPVKFATTNTLPTPLVAGTLYYVTNAVGSAFKVAATPGGAAITLGGSQAGTHTATLGMADLLREWIATSNSRFLSALEPTKYAYYNRIVAEDNIDSRHSGYPFSVDKLEPFHLAHKAIANANGLGLVQYEGSHASDVTAFTGDPDYAEVFEFFAQGAYSEECADVHTYMFETYTALGGVYPSKFVDCTPPIRTGAFGGQRFTGDSNPVWDAVIAFNGGDEPEPEPDSGTIITSTLTLGLGRDFGLAR